MKADDTDGPGGIERGRCQASERAQLVREYLISREGEGRKGGKKTGSLAGSGRHGRVVGHGERKKGSKEEAEERA